MPNALKAVSRTLIKKAEKVMHSQEKRVAPEPAAESPPFSQSQNSSVTLSTSSSSCEDPALYLLLEEDTRTKPMVGSFGSVTRGVAFNTQRGEAQHVAIKRCFDPREGKNEAAVASWLQQLMIPSEQGKTTSLQSRLCLPLFVGADNEVVYPLMRGGTMFSRLKRAHRTMRRPDVGNHEKRIMVLGMLRAWVLEVARALASLHDLGAAHGDIKSNNIMFQTPGDDVPVLIDIGSCGEADEQLLVEPALLEMRRRMPYYAKSAKPTRKQDDLYGIAALAMEVLCVCVMSDDEDLHACIDAASYCCDDGGSCNWWEADVAHLCKAFTVTSDANMPSMHEFATVLECILDQADN